uniref:Uncharacterized protein n=1 Tax=Caulobacter phage BL57 TaxID=3348355 RepID=A0AB74UL18_9VIRU
MTDLSTVPTALLIAELYRRPVALCVFEGVDLMAETDAFEDSTKAGQWLAGKASYVADAMSGAGWDSVRYHLTADGLGASDDDDDETGDDVPDSLSGFDPGGAGQRLGYVPPRR